MPGVGYASRRRSRGTSRTSRSLGAGDGGGIPTGRPMRYTTGGTRQRLHAGGQNTAWLMVPNRLGIEMRTPRKKDGGYPFRLELWPDDGVQVPFLLNFH